MRKAKPPTVAPIAIATLSFCGEDLACISVEFTVSSGSSVKVASIVVVALMVVVVVALVVVAVVVVVLVVVAVEESVLNGDVGNEGVNLFGFVLVEKVLGGGGLEPRVLDKVGLFVADEVAIVFGVVVAVEVVEVVVVVVEGVVVNVVAVVVDGVVVVEIVVVIVVVLAEANEITVFAPETTVAPSEM